jgi:hypothetical protein
LETEIDNFSILKNYSYENFNDSIDDFDIHNNLNNKFSLKKEINNLINFDVKFKNIDNIINNDNIIIEANNIIIINNNNNNNNNNGIKIIKNMDIDIEGNLIQDCTDTIVYQHSNDEYYTNMSIDCSTLVVSIPQELSKKPHCFSLVSIRNNNNNIVRDSSIYYNDSFKANTNTEPEDLIPLFDDRKRISLRLAADSNENKELFINNILEIILKSRNKNYEKFIRRNSKLPIGRRVVKTIISKPLRRISAYVDSFSSSIDFKRIEPMTRRSSML